jgi:scavenger receptor class B, member 1
MPKNIKKTDEIKVFRKAFCRKLPFHFSHVSEIVDGVEVLWFTTGENAIFDDPQNPETSCYCEDHEKCLKRGVGNVSPCYHSKMN